MSVLERILSRDEIEDFLIGAEILGTGGGGGVEWARMMLKYIWDRGKELRLIDPRDVPGDALVYGAAGVGGGVEEEILERIRRRLGGLPPRERYMERAVLVEKLMSGYLGEEPYALLAFELGCGNTMLPACIAAMVDKPLIDGDCCGRAVPEIELCTLNLAGIPFTPIAAVTPWMETILIKKALDYGRAEDLCRYLAVASGGGVTIDSAPLRGRELMRSITPNTVTWAMEVGRAIREARKVRRSPIEALLEATDGHLLFEGRVTAFKREGRSGFIWGEHRYEGVGPYEGHRFRVWFKNENLISWLDEEPYVTCPDLLCAVDAETGRGLSNWGEGFREGRRIAIIGVKAADIWRSEEGVRLFNPRHFDFDIDYRPLEELVS